VIILIFYFAYFDGLFVYGVSMWKWNSVHQIVCINPFLINSVCGKKEY